MIISRLRFVVAMGALGCSIAVSATPVLWPIDESTVVGTWEAVDLAFGSLLRLEVSKDLATLAIVGGEGQAEYLLMGKNGSVRKGKFTIAMTDETIGLQLKVEGRGKASERCGWLRITLRAVGNNALYWDGQTYEFAKVACGGGPEGDLMQAFVVREKRAKVLMDDSRKERRNQAEPDSSPGAP